LTAVLLGGAQSRRCPADAQRGIDLGDG